MKFLYRSGLILSVALAASSSQATLVASDDFGVHTNGDPLTSGDGTGWDANWTAQSGAGVYWNAGGLFAVPNVYNHSSDTYGNVGNSARVGRNILTTGGSAAATAGIVDGSGNIGADSTTVYIGFAMRAHNAGSPLGHYYGFEMHRDGNGDPNRILQVSTDGSNPNLGLRAQNNNSLLDTIGSDTTPSNYWVLKLAFGAANDTASVFLNPTLNAAEGLPDASVTASDLSFDRIGFAQFSGAGFVDFDDVRIGTEYADVVGPAMIPEPASLSLLGLGLTALWRMRRRS